MQKAVDAAARGSSAGSMVSDVYEIEQILFVDYQLVLDHPVAAGSPDGATKVYAAARDFYDMAVNAYKRSAARGDRNNCGCGTRGIPYGPGAFKYDKGTLDYDLRRVFPAT